MTTVRREIAKARLERHRLELATARLERHRLELATARLALAPAPPIRLQPPIPLRLRGSGGGASKAAFASGPPFLAELPFGSQMGENIQDAPSLELSSVVTLEASKSVADHVFTVLDGDRNGKITVEELKCYIMSRDSSADPEAIASLFSAIDAKKKGRITRKELRTSLGTHASQGGKPVLLWLMALAPAPMGMSTFADLVRPGGPIAIADADIIITVAHRHRPRSQDRRHNHCRRNRRHRRSHRHRHRCRHRNRDYCHRGG